MTGGINEINMILEKCFLDLKAYRNFVVEEFYYLFVFFIQEQQQTSLTQVQLSSSGRDLSAIPLPSGWEVIDHPEYGLFYVDHIHQKTQYDPPTQADFEESARLQAAVAGSCSSAASTTSTENNPNGNGSIHSSNGSRPGVAGSVSSGSDRFTDDVAQIKGPLVTAVLMKGPKGFGFTIIGGSSPGHPGFLQVILLFS